MLQAKAFPIVPIDVMSIVITTPTTTKSLNVGENICPYREIESECEKAKDMRDSFSERDKNENTSDCHVQKAIA